MLDEIGNCGGRGGAKVERCGKAIGVVHCRFDRGQLRKKSVFATGVKVACATAILVTKLSLRF